MFNYGSHMIKKWIRYKIQLLTFYWMLGVDKYVDVWINTLYQNMTYMITYKNLY
jgi:hypothetical protein